MNDLIARLRVLSMIMNSSMRTADDGLIDAAADAIESLDAALEAAQQLAMQRGDELNEKDAEIKRLKSVVDGLETLSLQRDRDYLVEIERLTAERDALREDAERYRWLRDTGDKTWIPLLERYKRAGLEFGPDAAIDAARKA